MPGTRVLTSRLGPASRDVGRALDGEKGMLKAEKAYYTLFLIYWSFGKEEEIRLHSQISSEHEFWGDTIRPMTEAEAKIKH